MDILRDRNGPQGGITFAKAQLLQSAAGLYWLEELMKERPIDQVVELGTYSGSLAVWFGLHCPGQVVTLDITDDKVTDHTRELFARLGVEYLQKDVLKPATVRMLANRRHGSTLWFVDAGASPVRYESFILYTPLMQHGDVMVMHDLGVEFAIGERELAIEEKFGMRRWKEAEQLADKTTLGVWLV